MHRGQLVGRERDCSALEALFRKRTHVTILGMAGVGKTRLAYEVLRRRPEGFLVCDLTDATNADDVLRALFRTLAAPPGDGRAIARIQSVLAAKGDTSLLLDGVDRVSPATWEETIGAIQAACPHLRVLATARARLGVPGEAVFPLAPLELAAAEELFLGLAESAIGRDLREDGRVPANVRALVRALDGLPLALEIAASALNVLSPEECLRRGAFLLDAPAPAISWGGGSLRAALEVSCGRLPDGARRALAALTAFVGDFDLPAVEAIVGPGALASLRALSDASLVSSVASGGRTRFRILECVRQFVIDREGSSEIVAEAGARHAAYFGEHAATWTYEGESHDRLGALAWLTAEETNLIAVVERTLETPEPDASAVEHAVGAMTGLAWLWFGRGPLEPHMELLRRVESLVSPDVLPESVAVATFQLALLGILRHKGDLDRAGAASAEALARARRLGRPYLEVRCLLEGARLMKARGDREAAAKAIDEAAARTDPRDGDLIRLHVILARRVVASLDEPSLLEASAIARRINDPLASAQVELAFARMCYAAGRLEDAIDHAREVVVAAKALRQYTWQALAAIVAGNALAELGRVDEARAMFEVSLEVGVSLAHRRSEAEARANLGLLDFEAGRLVEAAEQLGAATRLFRARDPMRLYFLAALAGVEASQARRGADAAARFRAARDEALRVAPALGTEVDRFGAAFRLVADTPAPSSHAAAAPTPEAMGAWRVARRVRERVCARVRRNAFVVAGDGTWFRAPGSSAVSVIARPVLAALLRELLRGRARRGAISRDELVRAIWPDERSSRRSMRNRLSVAISTLRTMGMTAIVATPREVALDERVEVDEAP